MTDTALNRVRRLSRTFEIVATAGIGLIAIGAVLAFVIPDWTRNLLLARLGQTGIALPLTPTTTLAAAGVMAVPLGVMLYGLWAVRGLFREFARGDVFGAAACRKLEVFGLTVLAQAPLGPLTATALALVTSLANPPGQRLLVLTLSINDYFALIVGGVLVAVARVMREAARLADENASFV
jgi:hypothetical protein